jgi:hypothetical protein
VAGETPTFSAISTMPFIATLSANFCKNLSKYTPVEGLEMRPQAQFEVRIRVDNTFITFSRSIWLE